MSRSFKKTPICKDGGTGRRWNKNQANRSVRKAKDVLDGCNYRKCYSHYDVCDVISYSPRNKFIHQMWKMLQWRLNYFSNSKIDYWQEFKDSFFKGIPNGRSWFKSHVWK